MITIQLDCAIADNFDLYYIDQNGEKKRPYIIHRTSMGCYERTLAWLIEKYAGKFPTWLCPEQVRVLPISEKYADYANEVCKELKKNDIDATVDNRSEKIGFKIREARLDKLPYMLVVGQQEEADGTVSVRSRYAGNEGTKPLAEFIDADSFLHACIHHRNRNPILGKTLLYGYFKKCIPGTGCYEL